MRIGIPRMHGKSPKPLGGEYYPTRQVWSRDVEKPQLGQVLFVLVVFPLVVKLGEQ
jgi:hypothetical protein